MANTKNQQIGALVSIPNHYGDGKEQAVVTGLTVFDGDDAQPVYLASDGKFVVIATDATRIARDSYEALNTYFNGVVERREKQKREAARKVDPLPVTLIEGYQHDAKPSHVDIKGMSIDDSRVLFRHVGGEPVKSISRSDRVYRRFTEADAAEYNRLAKAAKAASEALEDFRAKRLIGTARDIAQRIDRGEAPTGGKR